MGTRAPYRSRQDAFASSGVYNTYLCCSRNRVLPRSGGVGFCFLFLLLLCLGAISGGA